MTASHPLTLIQTGLSGGVWAGMLTGSVDAVPMIAAIHEGEVIAEAVVSPLPGRAGTWAVRLAIPAAVLSDGVQTVLLTSGGEVLASVTIIAGQPLDDDVRAELGLLRAELDLLKRAFQRQSRG